MGKTDRFAPMQKGDRKNMHTKRNPYIDQAKHCIGLDRKKPYIRHGKKFYFPYRNYFATGRDYEIWEVMESAGQTAWDTYL